MANTHIKKLNKNTVKDVIFLAFPAVGEMILYMTLGVLDTIMVGQYGGNISVSAVGLGTEIIYTFSNIFIAVGITIGITSLVARNYGAKNIKLAEEYATVGFFIGLVLSLLISCGLFYFSTNILKIAGAKDQVLTLGQTYIKFGSIGIFFTMLMSMLNGILRGYGNTKIPLLVSVLINIINLTLDWGLIFGHLGLPKWGVKGAAIATSTAQFFGFLFILIYIIFKSKIKLRPKSLLHINRESPLRLLKLAIPSSMQEGAFSLSKLMGTFIIMHLGAISFAANQIAISIESLSFMPGWGFGVAATTLVGQKIGQKQFDKAKEYAYTCTILGVFTMFLCSLLFILAPRFLIMLFIKSSEVEVIKLGTLCLMIASLEQVPMAVSMILGGALKGAGDTKTPFAISMFSNWIIRLPLMYYFIYVIKLSVVYAWWITTLQWVVDGLLVFLLFKIRSKKFKYMS